MYAWAVASALAALAGGALDDLVVDVGEVLDELHLEAAIDQVAANDVHGDEQPRVADVGVILGRHATHVHPQHPIRVQGDELVLATGQRGVDTDGHGRGL